MNDYNLIEFTSNIGTQTVELQEYDYKVLVNFGNIYIRNCEMETKKTGILKTCNPE